ncbi:molecular chaperone [Pseudomonas sp. LS-2]|jgi:P pilus assembly chaperone PapD|uniref:fimbrial biogenesis chaperone n=1 Tax=Pseudomonas sp. LS-2 TaxID=2315859 RepID=UPI000E75E0AD|nr:molecular chaperone [Pseudomonas sp. LS-2]RJX81538.1 molecular chaperone [Pseudomonas sp. LS-2]
MIWKTVVCALVAFFSSDAVAVVSLAGTRLIFDGRFPEAAIEVGNPGSDQVLIQAWLADANAPPGGKSTLPFVVTPHLAQLPAKGRQMMRVLYEGVGMPIDRESLLHLYVLEVPRRSEANQRLSIAVRQRINVFYRPKGLTGDPAQAAQMLAWHWRAAGRGTLSVRNPTPFHVVLQRLALNGIEVTEDLMIKPFSERTLPVTGSVSDQAASGSLNFKALTDYGGQREFCANVLTDTPFNARLRRPGAQSSIGKC